MKNRAIVFTVALFVVSMIVPATTWGWYFMVYNQTQNKMEAGAHKASGDWDPFSTLDVPAKGSVAVNMRGGYCLDILYIYTPQCRIQSGNKFTYYINCLGTGSDYKIDPGATCCWNVDVVVEEVGQKGADGFPICRVRLGKP